MSSNFIVVVDDDGVGDMDEMEVLVFFLLLQLWIEPSFLTYFTNNNYFELKRTLTSTLNGRLYDWLWDFQ